MYSDTKVFLYDSSDDSLTVYDYPLDEFIYHCGRKWVTPEGVGFGNKYLLVVLDANEATIAMLQGKKTTVLWTKESYVPRKHDAGGSSQRRFERGREEAKKQWLKFVAQKIKESIDINRLI